MKKIAEITERKEKEPILRKLKEKSSIEMLGVRKIGKGVIEVAKKRLRGGSDNTLDERRGKVAAGKQPLGG